MEDYEEMPRADKNALKKALRKHLYSHHHNTRSEPWMNLEHLNMMHEIFHHDGYSIPHTHGDFNLDAEDVLSVVETLGAEYVSEVIDSVREDIG